VLVARVEVFGMTPMEKKARKAMRLAKSVMDYCGGDAWEREVTQKDREKFDKLYDEVFGKGASNE
jgi:hypothetical protein